jgi:O-antigen/teichoic acid export membrane protein
VSKQEVSYRQVIKATSIFGGVQVINILVNVVKSKFIAIIIGPVGMGVSGLLSNSLLLIAGLTNFGLSTSAVKAVAEANASSDPSKLPLVISTIKRVVWFTGILGMLIMILLSSYLSKYAFGNGSYQLSFMIISVALLFQQVNSGYTIILQGLQRVKILSKATLIGSIMGVLLVLPLYYFFQFDAIVPGIIITPLVVLLCSVYFSKKIKIEKVQLTIKEALSEGKGMIKMGVMISLGFLMATASSYILQIYINNFGTTEELGLYFAGFNILNTYVGIIFSAMAADYFPRLSSVNSDSIESAKTINQQAEIVLLLISPILSLFFLTKEFVIVLLYSSEFLAMTKMIAWATLGIMFKSLSWPIAYLFLAKGETKLYFWNEFIAVVYTLTFNILGYQYWGLEGLGVSFLFSQVFYFIQCYGVSYMKFGFTYQKPTFLIFFFQFLFVLTSFLMSVIELQNKYYLHIIGYAVFIIAAVYSIVNLNRKASFFSKLRSSIKGKL